MTKIRQFLFSTRLMAVLFLVYALSLAVGTFIETYYSTDTARIWIYNAWWFEVIMLIFALNFIGNIRRYNLLKKENWAVFILHISWIFIIIGAGITRYIGDEGRISLREGETIDFYTSDRTYVTVQVDGIYQGNSLRKTHQKEVLFSEPTTNHFHWKSDFKGIDFEISYKQFIKGAKEIFLPNPQGDFYLKIVESSSGTRHEHLLKEGQTIQIHGRTFALNAPTDGAINFQITNNQSIIWSSWQGSVMQMNTQNSSKILANTPQNLQYRALYNIDGFQFVVPDSIQKGIIKAEKISHNQASANDEDAVIFEISSAGKSQEVTVFGRRDVINTSKTIHLNGLDFHINYGSIRKTLPFAIRLNDFIAEKYPGTQNSYSSFKSKVTVLSENPFDYDIYMNHILNYKGYRFFQASFHPDEKGSVLSVNQDFWGTLITYIGYTLLYIGLITTMFFGKTRFVTLSQKLKKLQQKSVFILLLVFYSTWSFAQHHTLFTEQQIDSVLKQTKVDIQHAEKFGHLVIQDDDGRMKPINTFSSELLRKISKNDHFKQMNANQVLLSMLLTPQFWYNVPFIYVKKSNDSLHNILSVEKKQKYIRAIDFFDQDFNYKLSPYLPEAYATNNPNQFQKDFKETDMKLNLLNRALSGSIFKIYPLLNNPNNKWISQLEYRENPHLVQDSLYGNFINNALVVYLNYLRKAIKTGDYTQADLFLEAFSKNQIQNGKNVVPSEQKIKAEILYNKINIFNHLFSSYLIISIILFGLLIAKIIIGKPSKIIKISINCCIIILIFLFTLHTLGLGMRWFISGHAPWSNAYESMIYVGWTTLASGLIFTNRSQLTLASTAFVSSMILMIAHWNWLDPSIGTLQPVLNSYWLMIHVAIIVGSYGPLTLGMILGIIAMLLMIIATEKNKQKINRILQEITIVNELSLLVGLIMLTIGNFLGGQWANESWGRYWGWDPKETWALISIMVYAFVLHMRIVPKLRGRWLFNFMSVIAFASILMTYFGVNFYLSGLHSYASGEKVITPNFVYYSAGIIAILAIVSYFKNKKIFK